MPRNVAYWEEKLHEAEERLVVLTRARERFTPLLKHAIKKSKKGTAEKRSIQRFYAEAYRVRIARLDHKIRQLKETKIPYYQERISTPPKTAWERLRRSDGLRL